MVKKAKIKQQAAKPLITESGTTFSVRKQDMLVLLLITILLVVYLKPMVIDGLSPQGVDIIASKGTTHQITEYNKKSSDRALWNPAIFSGMPIYYRSAPVTFSIDTLLNLLGQLFSNVFMYYWFAAIGCYWLFRYLKLSPTVAFCGVAVYLLMPHTYALVLVGHSVKMRALMLLPWVFLTFKYFLDTRSVLSVALFSLAFGIQIRTQHYQIIFYTGLLLFAAAVYPFFEDIKRKQIKRLIQSLTMLGIASVIALGLAAQPLFLAKEYLPYSKRGKMTIDLGHKGSDLQQKETADGVQMEYALRWSTEPSELLTWAIPRFYGGMNYEKYTGKTVRQRIVPGYWGSMTFTQSYEYMGALALLLAVIGIAGYHRNKMIRSLLFLGIFLILLSFGRHFQLLYSLFYDYFPFFNKFRTPMMSVTVNFFVVSILAVYGLKYLAEYTDANYKKIIKILVGAIIFGILLWIVAQTLGYTSIRDQYDQNTLAILRQIRKEMLISDLVRYFIIILAGGGAIFLYIKGKINFILVTLIVVLITIVDQFTIQKRYVQNFTNLDQLEKQYFVKTSTDNFLLKDPDLFRILPSQQNFNSNAMAYYHLIIGGYDPIKMYTIEELIQNCYFTPIDGKKPINWNILKMLNVKYVLREQKENTPQLTLVHEDTDQKLYTYKFTKHLPRGFFVSDYRVITDEYERLTVINDSSFHPEKTALLEEELSETIETPDSSHVIVTGFSPNDVSLDVYTDKQSLLVISELFYPPGWKIYLNQNPVEKIYKTDHALQSISVPAGKHFIELKFEPETYFRMINYARLSAGVLYLTIITALFLRYKEKIYARISGIKK